MGTLSNIRSFARSATEHFQEARRRRRTQRAIESLDLHILKDIGWVRSEHDVSANGRRGR